MKIIYSLFIMCGLVLLTSCQQQNPALTEEQKTRITDSARQVVEKVLRLSNRLDFQSALDHYSGDPDARYIENGSVFPSLKVMRSAYEQFGSIIETLENRVDRWDSMVLSEDAVLFVLPFHFTIKAKGLPEYNGAYMWSAVVQKRYGKWTIVHTHESWLNFAEAMAALTPPDPEEENK